MSDIDWSLAPEGATHYMPKYKEYSEVWIKDISDIGYKYIRIDSGGYNWEFTDPIMHNELYGMIERPSKPVTEDKISCYVCHVGAFPMQQYCGSCGHELLSELNPVTLSPIYTKEMADNGELPSVGMEFILIYDELGSRFNSLNGSEVKIISSSECGVYTFKSKVQGLGALYLKPHHCEPVTPPIELVDGKAYQFNFADDKVMFGIYNLKRNIFSVEQGTYFDFSRVYNIQLLEVKSHD